MSIAPRFRKLLDDCREMSLSHLGPLVERMFENADVALLDFAEKAESNQAQSLFFEAMNEIRRKHKAVAQCFFQDIGDSFDRFPDAEAAGQDDTDDDDEGGFGGLTLVKTDVMEESVAVSNAVRKLNGQLQEKLYALKQRLAVVNNGKPIEDGQIPAGPQVLGNAFRNAIDELDMETRVRIVIIALFDKYVLGHVGDLFTEYNERLIQADILPNLKFEIRKTPNGTTAIASQMDALDEARSMADATPEVDGEGDDMPLGDELFGNICALLATRRGGAPGGATVTPIHGGGGMTGGGMAAGGGMAGGGGMPGAGPAGVAGGGMPAGAAGGGEAGSGVAAGSPQAMLVSSINRVQSQVRSGAAAISSSEFIENIEIDTHLIENLQQTMAQEREKIFGAVDRRKVPTADSDVIDLVGMLFEFMLKEEHVPNIVKALLSRLHTPLLKVAIIDRQFFTRNKHPARRLLNDMTAAGIRWVNEQHLESGIFPKMKDIVDRVLLDFDENVEVFEGFVEEFDKAVEELKRRSKVVEKRTTAAADGQEKLQAARHRAQDEVRAIMQGRALPQETRDFLARLWTDKLTFILLRDANGDTGEAWRDAVDVADQVCAWSLAPASEDERLTREAGIMELMQEVRGMLGGTQQADKEAVLQRLGARLQAALKEEALEPPAASAVEAPPAAEPEQEEEVQEALEEETVELSAEEQAMLDKLHDIDFGTWFDFTDPDTGAVKRAKLSWRSTVTEKFMFVDQMGVKAAVISMTDLARAMVEGSARIVRPDRKPFVDRALGAIHRMLDRGVAAASA